MKTLPFLVFRTWSVTRLPFSLLSTHYLNDTYANTFLQVVTVTRYKKHPGFGLPTILNNDITILHFTPSVTFNRYVSPVCVPEQGQQFAAGTDVYAIGWRNTQGKYDHNATLLYHNVTLPFVVAVTQFLIKFVSLQSQSLKLAKIPIYPDTGDNKIKCKKETNP